MVIRPESETRSGIPMEAFVGTRAGELSHPLEGIGYHVKGKWPKGLKEWLILRRL
jgi:hypothetical protein